MASDGSADQARPLFKRWRVWLGVLLLSPLLLWAVLLLGLMTPWGKSFVASKIKQRTGVSLQIGGVGFIPGGDVWLSDLEWENAGTIAKIEVSPRWLQLLKGNRAFSEVRIIDPNLDISLSELKSLMPVPVPAAPPEPVEPVEPEEQAQAPTPPSPVPVPPNNQQGQAIPGPQAPAVGPAPQAPSAGPQHRAASQWLRLSEGTIKIRKSPESPVLLDLSGLKVDLPLDGEGDPGVIKIAKLAVLGVEFEENQEWKVANVNGEWQALVKGERADLGKFEAQVRISRAAGFPFLMSASATTQQKFEFGGAAVQGAMLGRLSLGGVVKNSASWRGSADIFGSQVRLSAGRSQLAYFDEMQGRAILAGPRIPLAEFRAQGDQGALIALGEASSAGLDAWVRLVVAPSYQDQLNRSLDRVAPEWRAAELETPDRYYVDLYTFFKNGKIWVDTGMLDRSLPLSEIQEKVEEGLANPAQFGVER